MNRADRRANKKYSEIRKAWHQGFSDGSRSTFKSIYAAICLALEELHGFDSDQCVEVLRFVDNHVTMSFASLEIAEEVLDRLGIELDFESPSGKI